MYHLILKLCDLNNNKQTKFNTASLHKDEENHTSWGYQLLGLVYSHYYWNGCIGFTGEQMLCAKKIHNENEIGPAV